LRSMRFVDCIHTLAQVMETQDADMQYKILYGARFLKEYQHGLAQKWRLRADKIAFGIITESEDNGNLWEPEMGRPIGEVIASFPFHKEDDILLTSMRCSCTTT
jgi:hypothetical protein